MYEDEIRKRAKDVERCENTNKLMVKQIKRTADVILSHGALAIGDRAAERDTKSERSMNKTVKAFNAMYNKNLTEVEGWQFMVLLKMCRASQGNFRMDDYEDQASYSALAGEAAQE